MMTKFLKKALLLSLALTLLLCSLAAPAPAYDKAAYRAWSGSESGLKALPMPPESQLTNSAYIFASASLFINGAEQLDPHIHLAPVINYTAYVPLRLVSEQLGAQVSYGKGLIIISQGDMELKLQLGDNRAYKSDSRQYDQPIDLTTAPFVCDGATYVPLRFIAEALGCQVDYQNGVIQVNSQNNQNNQNEPKGQESAALNIKGQPAARLAFSSFVTMDADVYEISDPTLLSQVYQALQASLGEPAAAPRFVTGAAAAGNGDFSNMCQFEFFSPQGELLHSLFFYRQYQNPAEPARHEATRPYPYVITDTLAGLSYSCTEEVYTRQLSPLIETIKADSLKAHSRA